MKKRSVMVLFIGLCLVLVPLFAGAETDGNGIYPLDHETCADELPVGDYINLYGYTTSNVNLREEATSNSKTKNQLKKNVYLYIVENVFGEDDGTVWSHVLYNGAEGYILSRFITVMSFDDSSNYNLAQSTPVPVYPTPGPELTPTPVITPTPTPVPAEQRINRSFSVHSGVMFGMTKNEVIEQEKCAGFVVDQGIFTELSTCRHGSNYVMFTGTVAGVKGASILYHFNRQDILESVVYLVGYSPNKYGTGNTFTSFSESLSQKYEASAAALTAIENGDLDFCVNHFEESLVNSSAASLYRPYSKAFISDMNDGSVMVIYICSVNAVLQNGNTTGELLLINYQVYDSKMYYDTVKRYEKNSILDDL